MSNIARDDPPMRALVNFICGQTEELPRTISEPGETAYAWFRGSDDPCVKAVRHAGELWCEVDLDARPDWAAAYLAIPMHCWLHDIPCYVMVDGDEYVIAMRRVV